MKQHRTQLILKIVFAAVFLISLFVALEFGSALLQSLIPEITDGIPAPGTLMQLFFGEDGWTREGYFTVSVRAGYVAFASLLGYSIVALVDSLRRKP